MNTRDVLLTWTLAAVVATGLAAPGSALGSPVAWHVSPAGSDSADGSYAAPFATIQHAVDIAAEGDTVRLFDGDYTGAGNAPVAWRDKGLVIASLGGDPALCVIRCEGQDGFRFVDTDLTGSHALSITGLSFTDADTAVAVLRTGHAYGPLVWARLEGCRASGGNVGVAAHGGWLLLDGCDLSGNQVAGIAGGYVFGLTMDRCVVRDNGVGLSFMQMNASPAGEITACEFVGNGTGISYWQESCGLTLRSCRVDSSTAGPGIRATSDHERLTLEGCDINGNAGHGIANAAGTAVLMTGGEASGNGLCGVAMAPGDVAFRLAGVRLADNGAWGVGPYAHAVEKDGGVRGADKDPARDVEITDCDILANGAGGVSLVGASDPVSVAGSTIAGNGGVGLRLGSTRPGAVCKAEGATIAANQGHGLELAGGDWELQRILVTGNKGVAVILTGDGTTAALGCSDLFGNDEGDWTGPLLPQLGIDGNVQVDPLYCNALGGDWSLREDSPAAPAGSDGCGQIGRHGVECPAPPSLVAPVPRGGVAAALAAWPNPFNPRTTVAFSVAGDAPVRLGLYDLAGRLMCVLVDASLPAGEHQVVWDGRDAAGRAAASGLYVARLESGNVRGSVRLHLVR
ncbi:MAG: right-handed parallel beta-helix repeat-containing protein [bacterium]|nr:right-handed parallel beta-helix repeat-containing protein [bacterium]